MRLDPAAGAALARRSNVRVLRLDVEDPGSIEAAVASAAEHFQGVDVLVNNAGFGVAGVFEAIGAAKVLEQFRVNLFGLMDVTRAVLPGMRARRSGVIVNISSGAGVFGLPTMSLYCSSKFAVEGFSEAFSYELAALGIAVKIIEPGGVPGTGFNGRTGAEAVAIAPIADYDGFLLEAEKVFVGLLDNAAGTTAAEVAEVIYAAATDGTDRLRYVATRDIAPWVAARRETSEEAYLATMRSVFVAAA